MENLRCGKEHRNRPGERAGLMHLKPLSKNGIRVFPFLVTVPSKETTTIVVLLSRRVRNWSHSWALVPWEQRLKMTQKKSFTVASNKTPCANDSQQELRRNFMYQITSLSYLHPSLHSLRNRQLSTMSPVSTTWVFSQNCSGGVLHERRKAMFAVQHCLLARGAQFMFQISVTTQPRNWTCRRK